MSVNKSGQIAALVVATMVVTGGASWILLGSPAQKTTTGPASSDGRPRHRFSSSHVRESNRPTDDTAVQSSTALVANWKAEFEQSKDLKTFVLTASEAAERGDPAAAWYVGAVIANCAAVIHTARQGGGDAEQRYISVMTSRFTTSEQVAGFTADYRRCAGLAENEKFADWRQEKGGKMTASFWRNLALELGSPTAKVNFLVTNVSKVTKQDSPAQREAMRSKLRDYARDVVTSRDPDALFTLGSRLMSGDVARDVTYGFALALAACDLGYDCSGANMRNGWSSCKSTGLCPDRTFPEIAQEMLSSKQYASAYALAEEFKDRAAREEWGELERFIRLDGPLLQ